MNKKRHSVVLVAVVLFLASAVPLVGGTAQTAFSRSPSWIYEFLGFDVPGASNTVLSGINNNNVIVGWTTNTEGFQVSHGFIFSNGTFAAFDVPAAGNTWPLDISDRDVVVGWCECATSLGAGYHGFRYAAGAYTIAPFEPIPGVHVGKASGINNNGQIVGWFEQMTPGPNGTDTTRWGYVDSQQARSILFAGNNDAGHLTGLSFVNGVSAFFHNGTTTTAVTLPFRPGEVPEPEDVNNADTVVGSYLLEAPPDMPPAFRGFVWSNGKAVSINFPGAYTTFVTGINDAGTIVGHYGEGSTSHGFIAVPHSPVTVTANGIPRAIAIDRTQPLRVDVEFIAPPNGPLTPAEVYVGVVTPYGVFWVDGSGRFVTTPTRVFAGSLASFGPSPVINLTSASVLPSGTYTWFAIVDDDTNGTPNATFYDLAQVTIR